MTRVGQALHQVLRGTSDRAIRFEELRTLLAALSFAERTRGSHQIFTRDGVAELVNLQPRDGGLAKPYQVREVRAIIVKYRLAEEVQ